MKKTSAALLQKIFSLSSIPMCLLLDIKKEIQLSNQAFCKLSGYSEEEMAKIKLQDLIYKKDFVKIVRRIDRLDNDRYIFEELRVLGKGTSCVDIAITISKINHDKKHYFLCTLYDVGAYKETTRGLQEKIDQEREKFSTTIKSIIRTQKLFEKLHIMPSFFREMWNCKEEEVLIQKIVHLMCHASGLQYSATTILLSEGEFLQVKSSSEPQPLQRFHLKKQHRLAQVFRGEEKLFSPETGEFCIAIISPQGTEGVLQVFLNEKERILLVENENLVQPHLDLLECFAEFLGILLHHLRSSSRGTTIYKDVSQLKEEMEKRESVVLMQIRWSNYYECVVDYTEKVEVLHNEITKNILSFKPTGSQLYHVGEKDFFLLIPSHLTHSEKSEAQKIHRKLLNGNYTLGDEDLELVISMGVIKKKASKSSEELLHLLLKCIEKADKKSLIYAWDKKIQLVKQRSRKKLE